MPKGPSSAQPLFELEPVGASAPYRTRQADELAEYVAALVADRKPLAAVFQPDFRSPKSYLASARGLREALRLSLGYPPPRPAPLADVEIEEIGRDRTAVYFRYRVQVLDGVHATGVYFQPAAERTAPLVLACHGGGGSPELATFNGGANYLDMVRGAVERGYAVVAPQLLFQADGHPEDIRQRVDQTARLAGTTITAIEIAKIARSLDFAMERPEVDPRRVAMIGLSYGGFYTLFATALEPRIKVAVSSCYFSDHAALLAGAAPSGWSDWRFTNGLTLLSDPEIVALICPRPLQIQVGQTDDLFPVDDARRVAPRAAGYYRELGMSQRFEFVDFEGGHEFRGDVAWAFLRRHL